MLVVTRFVSAAGHGVRSAPRIAHRVAVQIVRPDRHLSVPARDVQHIGRPAPARSPARAARPAAGGPRRSARETAPCRGRGRAGAGSRASPARPSIARNSASSASALSFTPRSSTDCPSTGTPRACTRRSAARAAGVNSRAWLACTTSQSGFSVSSAVGQRFGHARRVGDRHARVDAQQLDMRDGGERAREARPAGAAPAAKDRRRTG